MAFLTLNAVLSYGPTDPLGRFDTAVLLPSGSGAILVASARENREMVSFRLSAGGTLSFADRIDFPLGYLDPVDTGMALVADGSGFDLTIAGRSGPALLGYTLSASGQFSPTPSEIWRATDGGGIPVLSQQLTRGDEQLQIVTRHNSTDLGVIRTQNGAVLGEQSFTLPVADPGETVITDLAVVSSGGRDFVITALAGENAIRSHEILPDASLTPVGEVTPAAGLGINDPSALEQVVLGGKTFILAVSAAASTLAVLELAGDGTLVPRDLVLDDLNTRFAGAGVLAVAMDGDRAFVIAGGGDDGLSAFQLLETGRLVHLGTIADSYQMTLDNPSALSATVIGGRLHVISGSSSETGLTHLSADLQTLGDVVIGDGSGAVVAGGAGDDILQAMPGSNRLQGGAGDDLFVFTDTAASADGDIGQVLDYEPGADRLDLSGLPLLRSVAQLDFTAQTNGISLHFAGYTLRLFSHDGTPIDSAAFSTASILNATHLELGDYEPMPEQDENDPPIPGVTLTGTALDDTLTGGAGDDSISGLDGHDTLDGLAGADTLNGGAGDDTILGGAGDDIVYGGDGNDDIDTGLGDDYVEAGEGDDTLRSAAGADTLHGGAGNDLLIMDFSAAAPAQTGFVDLAAGTAGLVQTDDGRDVITGVEHVTVIASIAVELSGDDGANTLTGGTGHDTLQGRGGGDRLVGGAGNDILLGLAGDDDLAGGDGNDTLIGGAGADLLDGGEHGDVYTVDANDTITDTGTIGLDVAQTNDAAGITIAIGGWSGLERFNGYSGDDTIDATGMASGLVLTGNGGADTLTGGLGNDVILGGAGDDTLGAAAGNNHFDGGSGADTYTGGSGNDVFMIDDAGDTITDAGGGFDRAVVNAAGGLSLAVGGWAGVERIVGYTGDDTIDATGASTTLVLLGGDGADTLTGGSAADILLGGDGNDTLNGGDGDDQIQDGAGDDLIDGGDGSDLIYLSGTNDQVTDSGLDGFDRVQHTAAGGVTLSLAGWSGVERLQGLDGADSFDASLYGSAIILAPGGGDDTLTGSAFGDTFYAGDGNDTMWGGGGDDALIGGAGDDWLKGGAGDDFLAGSDGGDAFVFGGSDGEDVIKDFDVAEDRLVFESDWANLGLLDLRLDWSDGHTIISSVSSAHQVTLADITVLDVAFLDIDFL